MKQVKQVVMLSTEKANPSLFFHCPFGNPEILSGDQGIAYHKECIKSGLSKPQHIYFIDNSEIKEGDYDYLSFTGKVNKVTEEHLNGNFNPNKLGAKKVIASTDKEITPNSWIPESFVKKYIEMYNAGTPITEVNVEYELVNDCNVHQYKSYDTTTVAMYNKYLLKTREDGSIIISPSRTYSREEVIKVANLVADKVKESPYILPFELNKLIEEHL